VLTRLDQGPGWTLDVQRARRAGDGGGGNDAIDAAAERAA
jgi:hypothetical protein